MGLHSPIGQRARQYDAYLRCLQGFPLVLTYQYALYCLGVISAKNRGHYQPPPDQPFLA